MLPAESAHDTVAALGEVGLLQFKDLNPDKSAFQRTFANQVRPPPGMQLCKQALLLAAIFCWSRQACVLLFRIMYAHPS